MIWDTLEISLTESAIFSLNNSVFLKSCSCKNHLLFCWVRIEINILKKKIEQSLAALDVKMSVCIYVCLSTITEISATRKPGGWFWCKNYCLITYCFFFSHVTHQLKWVSQLGQYGVIRGKSSRWGSKLHILVYGWPGHHESHLCHLYHFKAWKAWMH